MEEYIKKYFDTLTANLKKHLASDVLPIVEKEKVKIRLELIEEMRHNISWQFKNEEQKQTSRLLHLASMRMAEVPIKYIVKQEKAIRIYEQMNLTLPYLEALSNNLLEPVIDFCKDLITRIDLAGPSYDKGFPADDAIKQAFKPYFEIVKEAKGSGDVFNECHTNIEFLYAELMKLNEK